MSSALVRQALAFVDPEENKAKGKKRANDTDRHRSIGQVSSHPYKKTNKKQYKAIVTPKGNQAEENIKKLLALSTPIGDTAVVQKIIERAVKGKPLLDKIEVKTDTEEQSILFPEENLKKSKKNKKK